MKRRILPALLALAMVLTMLPLTVFAENPTTVETTVPDGTAQVSAWPTQTNESVSVATEGGVTTYKLSKDVTLTANLTVGQGEKMILDLDGHTLYCTKANGKYLFVQVGAGGDLKVCDTGATKGMFITQDIGINVNGAGSKLVVDGIQMQINSGDDKIGHYGIQLNSDLTADSSVEIKDSTITGKGIYACAFNVNGKLRNCHKIN